jgi:hypothetical protein
LLDTVKELRASIGRSSSCLKATSCLGDVGRGTIPSVHLYRERLSTTFEHQVDFISDISEPSIYFRIDTESEI